MSGFESNARRAELVEMFFVEYRALVSPILSLSFGLRIPICEAVFVRDPITSQEDQPPAT